MSYLPPVFQVLLLAISLGAGLFDLRSRRIPNLLVLCGLVLGFALNSFLYGTEGFFLSLKGSGLALLIYFPLFAIRAMGAGDAKLMAAIGAIVGPGNWLAIFFFSIMLGGLLALIVVLAKHRMQRTFQNILLILRELAHFRAPYLQKEELVAGHEQALSMPHGAVISVATLFFLAAILMWAPR